MDRFSYYQPGDSMEGILCQAGNVAIYEGELKQTAFERGTISLTLHRIIWADSTDPECRLILHHALINRIEKQRRSLFGRSGKIMASVKSVPHAHSKGPVAASAHNSIRFVFRNGGEDEFYKCYLNALNRRAWLRVGSSPNSSCGSGAGDSGFGDGVQKHQNYHHHHQHNHHANSRIKKNAHHHHHNYSNSLQYHNSCHSSGGDRHAVSCASRTSNSSGGSGSGINYGSSSGTEEPPAPPPCLGGGSPQRQPLPPSPMAVMSATVVQP